MSDKTDSIGWQAELLCMDIVKRDQLNTVVHNSMADADDPTVGISLFGRGFRIPLPDLYITRRGGTLFTGLQKAQSHWVEVKAKTRFGSFEKGNLLTTGFENRTLECYHRFSEECGQVVEVWFVHILPEAQANKTAMPCRADTGIYKADIESLYESRWRPPFNTNLAYWPIRNSVLKLVTTMEELLALPRHSKQGVESGPYSET